MAIVATAKILTEAKQVGQNTCSQDRRVRRDAQKVARSAAALLARLEAPRYHELPEEWEDVVDGIDPERLVLVFINEPPVALGTPSFDSFTGWRPRANNEPWNVPMGYDHDVTPTPARKPKMRLDLETGEFVEIPHAFASGPLAPILDEDECAGAAFRALMAEAHEHGPAVEWDVLAWSDEKGTWDLRRYIGTESAMRRNFPDWQETERMRACGVVGAPAYAPAPGQHYPAPGPVEFQGHEAPAVPYRIRRHIGKP